MIPITLSSALDCIRAGDYERRPDGLYLPGGKLGYVHHVTHIDRGGRVRSHESTHNIFPYESINYLLNVGFHGQTPITTWYLFPFEGNYTPALTDTMATVVAAAVECTAYDETSRPEYAESAANLGVIDNATARSVVTFNAAKSLYGTGLSSNPAKGATSGILASLARFSAKKDMGVGEQLLLTHALILTSPPPS